MNDIHRYQGSRFILLLILALFLCAHSAGHAWAQSSFDHITRSINGNIEVWRITEPDVKVPTKAYPAIRFQKGDQVEVKAGGCVNIGPGGELGKSTLTWRNYVYPKLDVGVEQWYMPGFCAKAPLSQQNYGTINIPGVTQGFKPLRDIYSQTVTINGVTQYVKKQVWTIADPGAVDYLQLGYLDSKHTDNSYEHPDSFPEGFCHQCTGKNAWVEITITKTFVDLAVSAACPAAGSQPSIRTSLPLEVRIKNLGSKPAVFPAGATLISYGAQGFSTQKMVLSGALQLLPGQEFKTSLAIPPFTPNPGSYSLMVQADPANSMWDPNPANNRVAIPVTLVTPGITAGTQTGTNATGTNATGTPSNTSAPGGAVKIPKLTRPQVKTPGTQNTTEPR